MFSARRRVLLPEHVSPTIRIRYDDAIRPNTNRLFRPLFGTEANTNRIFGTSLINFANALLEYNYTTFTTQYRVLYSGTYKYSNPIQFRITQSDSNFQLHCYIPFHAMRNHTNAWYTPPTRRNCLVGSRCVHEFATSSRRLPTDSIDNLETVQTDSIAVWRTTWISIDTDNFFNSDDIMTSLLKKLSIFIKIGAMKRYGVCLASFKIVDRIRRQSSSASCKLCSHRRRRRDKIVSSRYTPPTRRNSTVSSHRRCVLGLKVGEFSATTHCSSLNSKNQQQICETINLTQLYVVTTASKYELRTVLAHLTSIVGHTVSYTRTI